MGIKEIELLLESLACLAEELLTFNNYVVCEGTSYQRALGERLFIKIRNLYWKCMELKEMIRELLKIRSYLKEMYLATEEESTKNRIFQILWRIKEIVEPLGIKYPVLEGGQIK